MQRKNTLAYLASIGYASIFGLSFLFSKQALEVASPLKLISFRFLLGFLMMSLLLVCRIIKVNYKGKKLKDLMVLSMAQPVIYFIFEAYGIQHSSSSYAGLFVALIPILVSLLGIYLLKEIPSKPQWFFIFLSVAGVVYIVFKDRSPDSPNTLLGTLLLFIAIIASAVYNIWSRKSSSNFSPIEITYFMMGTGAFVFNLITLFIDSINGELKNFFQPLLSKDFMISIVYLGILSSIIAFFLMNYALSQLPASKSTVFSNLATIISIIAGVVFLKESFHYYHILGSLMILSGIVGTNYFSTKSIGSLEKKEGNKYAASRI